MADPNADAAAAMEQHNLQSSMAYQCLNELENEGKLPPEKEDFCDLGLLDGGYHRVLHRAIVGYWLFLVVFVCVCLLPKHSVFYLLPHLCSCCRSMLIESNFYLRFAFTCTSPSGARSKTRGPAVAAAAAPGRF